MNLGTVLNILIFILTLSFLIIIHELGHFLTARKFGIKVLEFGFGIPPRVWGKKIGETLISLNWLPLGGFVRLYGEDEGDKEALKHKRSFAAQNVWKRIVVVIAGVSLNLIFAWIMFTALLAATNFKTEVQLIVPHKFVGVTQTNEAIVLLGNVAEGSPAKQAGITEGDRVVALNNQPVSSAKQFVDDIKAKAGQEVTLTLADIKNTTQRQVQVTPRKDPPEGQGALGVGLGSFEIANLEYKNIWQKIFVGPIHSLNMATFSFKTLGYLFSQALASRNIEPVAQGLGSPIAIGYYSDLILKSPNPLIPYLNLVAMISFGLALFNVLPIPALDGGRLFFLLIEAVTKKRVNPDFERKVHTIGMALLLSLFLLLIWSDINTYILQR